MRGVVEADSLTNFRRREGEHPDVGDCCHTVQNGVDQTAG